MKLKPDEIHKKCDELRLAEQAWKERPLLLAQRDQLEEKILLIKSNHKPLKNEMRRIDALLDESEDLTEEKLNEMRESFFNEHEEAKVCWQELKQCKCLATEIGKAERIVRTVLEVLRIVIKTRSEIKGKGLLRYIFGVSPNMIIERHLLYAGDFIKQNLPDLGNGLGSDLEPLFEHVHIQLVELMNHCKKVWGFQHIDTAISNAEKEFTLISELLENHAKMNREEIQELEERLLHHRDTEKITG